MTDETTSSADNQSNAADPAVTPLSRRDFLKASAVVAATTVVTGCATTPKGGHGPMILPSVPARERLRVGVIGCGGRGTGAARDCV